MADTTLTVSATGCTIVGGVTATSSTSSITGAASADYASGGKLYFECVATTVATNDAVGLINSSGVLTTAANGTGKLSWLPAGTVEASGTSIGTAAAYASTNLLCIAVDLGARLFWGRVGAAGNWNNSATANPATGSGGFSFALGPLAPFVLFDTTGHTVTFNFGSTAFTGSVPSGFTSGWPTTTAQLIVTQVGADVWVKNQPNEIVTQVGLEVWQTTITETRYRVSQLGIELWRTSNVIPPINNIRPWFRHHETETTDNLEWFLNRKHTLGVRSPPHSFPSRSLAKYSGLGDEEQEDLEWLLNRRGSLKATIRLSSSLRRLLWLDENEDDFDSSMLVIRRNHLTPPILPSVTTKIRPYLLINS